MFKSIFTKTLYQQRWSIVFWGLGVIGMCLLMMAFYHSFSGGQFDEALKNLPESMKGLVGDVSSLKTVPGYVSQEVFGLRVPLLLMVMSIMLFTGLLAGEEGEGTLQTALSQPVSRFKVYIEKLAAGIVVSLVICMTAVVGVWVGLILIHETMSFMRLIEAALGVWLLVFLFGSLGFAIGAVSGRRGFSGSIAGLIAFSTYLLTSFAPSVSGIKTIERLSPFHYYNNPGIAANGLHATNVWVMLGVSAVFLLVSAVIFLKRDIYQR